MFHACTSGHVTRQVKVGGMLVIDASVPPGTWLTAHEHPHRSLVVVLEGGFRERVHGEDVEVVAGSLYVRPAALRHSHLFGAELTRFLIVELPERPDLELATTTAYSRPLLLRSAGCARIGQRVARLTWDEQPANRLRLESLLLELLACVAAHGANAEEPPAWLQQVHQQLRDAFRDPPTVQQLATGAGVHPSHLLRRFRRHYGMSPAGLVRRWKAEYARTLLAEPGASLSAVAFEAGFADQSHMGRVLRRIYGTTPGRLQREELTAEVLLHGRQETPRPASLPPD